MVCERPYEKSAVVSFLQPRKINIKKFITKITYNKSMYFSNVILIPRKVYVAPPKIKRIICFEFLDVLKNEQTNYPRRVR